jgi:hypothetical protein
VFGLRLRQISWQTIGDLFGITRQAAQQRFAVAALIDKMATEVGETQHHEQVGSPPTSQRSSRP